MNTDILKRVVKVRMSMELLSRILRGEMSVGGTIVTDAPPDLQVVGVGPVDGYLLFPTSVWIYVASETFDEVPEGAMPPEHEPFTYKVEFKS